MEFKKAAKKIWTGPEKGPNVKAQEEKLAKAQKARESSGQKRAKSALALRKSTFASVNPLTQSHFSGMFKKKEKSIW